MIELTGDLRGALVIAAAFLALLITAELWMRLGRPKPEWTRKLVHLGGGVISLALPWFLESPFVVLLLTASLSALFLLGEKTKLLRSLHGVERKSRGSEYYPLAIWLVFVIAADRLWLYVAAVLVLAVADAFAALAGTKYGEHRYEVEDSEKSVEGSVVFFCVAFMALHLPMLLMSDLPRAVCVLAALLVAVLVTLFEAISLEGTDNIFVPVAVVFVLQKITTKPEPEIAFHLVSLVVMIAVIVALAWRIRWFNAGGAFAITLFTFAAWSLGPRFRWVIPVFLGLAALLVLRLLVSRANRTHRVRAVTRALLGPFLFLLAANMTSSFDRYYAPYLAACASVVSFIVWSSGARVRATAGWNRALVAGSMGAIAAATITVPMVFIHPPSSSLTIAIVIVVVTLASILHARVPLDETRWTGASFLLVILAGAGVLGLQMMGWVGGWGGRGMLDIG